MTERIQKFLLDDKKHGRLLKVEMFEVTRTLKKIALTGKKQTETKKKYLMTVYNRVMVREEIVNDDSSVKVVEKEKFVKWGEFTFAEALHPKDRIKEFLSKVEIPLSYITDQELMDEAASRGILQLEKLPDEVLTIEMKRRGLTEYANNFKISKNATLFQKIKAFLQERKKIPDAKLTFEQTIDELKKRHLLDPRDVLTDDELIKELDRRDMREALASVAKSAGIPPRDVLDSLFEDDLPPSPDELDISDIKGVPMAEIMAPVDDPEDMADCK